jgi:hypothetical protein
MILPCLTQGEFVAHSGIITYHFSYTHGMWQRAQIHDSFFFGIKNTRYRCIIILFYGVDKVKSEVSDTFLTLSFVTCRKKLKWRESIFAL